MRRHALVAIAMTFNFACGTSASDRSSAPGGGNASDAGTDATTSPPASDAGSDARENLDATAPPSDGAATDAATPTSDAACPPTPLATSLLPLVDAITASISAHGGPGTNAASVPSTADRDAFAATVVAALSGDDGAACALPASYRLVSFADGADTLRAIAELDASGKPAPSLFWGTYVARAGAPFARVVVEAPHPVFDSHTEHEAADVFLHARAGALLVAGSHRCADDATSGCTGTTTACGGTSAPFRVSDAAHSVALPFYAVHDAISRASSAPFLQLHGNTESCPDALVSDSSGAWSDAGIAATLARALEANGASVGRCGAGFPTSGCDLCGTDNVEARDTAGSAAACTAMGAAYGRFVHVEQQPGLRATPDGGAGGYAPMLAAVAAAFP